MLKKLPDTNTVPDRRPKARATFRRFVIRWHRRIGLISAVLVLILAVTGIILNRTVDWRLDERLVKSEWVANWYGLSPKSAPIGFKAGAHWVTVLDDQIYIDARHVGLKDGEIYGAAWWDEGIIIATTAGLTAYSKEGQLFDQIGPDTVPGQINKIGQTQDGTVVISTDQGMFAARQDLRQWKPANSAPHWSRPSLLPVELRSTVLRLYAGRGLPLSRILLDIHSGRFFGPWGIYVMDAAAIFLMLLTLSGIYNWWVRR